MNIEIRAYREDDLPEMIRIWNEIVEEGIAFPQKELLDIFCRTDLQRRCHRQRNRRYLRSLYSAS